MKDETTIYNTVKIGQEALVGLKDEAVTTAPAFKLLYSTTLMHVHVSELRRQLWT